MKNKRIELTLPEWAFLDANAHEGDKLQGRTLILHVRSATVIEILDRDNQAFGLNPDVVYFKFKNVHIGEERLTAVVHYCCTLDVKNDKQAIIDNVLKPCAKWYCDYCDWEDNNVMGDILRDS